MATHFDNDYKVQRFHQRLQESLKAVEKVLASNKASQLVVADKASHRYEDKYLLAEQLVGCGAASVWNALLALGLTEKQYAQFKEWRNQQRSVSLMAEFVSTCVFEKETVREERGGTRTEVKVTGMFRASTEVITRITEYHYKYACAYRLVAYIGSDSSESNSIVIAEHDCEQTCVLRSKTAPYPERGTRRFDVNISWLVDVVSSGAPSVAFSIDRSKARCFTPRRNGDVDKALACFQDLGQWSNQLARYLQHELFAVQTSHTRTGTAVDVSSIHGDSVFNPVLPLFYGREDDTTDTAADAAVESAEPSEPSAVPLTEDCDAGTKEPSAQTPGDVVAATSVTTSALSLASTSRALLKREDVSLFLSEQMRTLQAKGLEVDAMVTASRNTREEQDEDLAAHRREHDLICAATARLAISASHLVHVALAVHEGLDFIEYMLRRQLVAAIGRELGPSDFAAYMNFHYRKILAEGYQPGPFSEAVRRSATHSPEGSLRLEADFPAAAAALAVGADGTQAEAVRTFRRSLEGSEAVSLALNASTKVSFRGTQHVHCWLTHAFSCHGDVQRSALPRVRLVAQARQFSSFIVLVGRMNSRTEFDPKHAFIVRNKDEWMLSLLLDPIPTPKQFRDAIESLSPEQQRFAKAFRSMQLESTLFAVCVVQIKPQLEKVLNLDEDSLTKEIQLTEDLMTLFIDHQIPPDLLSFDGDTRSCSKTEKVNRVRTHVAAMMEMLEKAKEAEVKAANQQREYLHGHQRRLCEDTSESECCVDDLFEERSMKQGFDSDYAGGDGSSTNTFKNAAKSVSGSLAKPASPAKEKKSFLGGMVRRKSAKAEVGSFERDEVARSSTSTSALLSKRKQQPAALVEGSSAGVEGTSAAPLANTESAPTDQPSTSNDDTVVPEAVPSRRISLDVTQLPARLDAQFSALDRDNALRPTIINVDKVWTKRAKASLLAAASTDTVEEDGQQREKQRAVDLLDALTRSGGLELEHATLHVVIATTHGFEETLLNTLIHRNMNPIECVERSALIILSTLHACNDDREEDDKGGERDSVEHKQAMMEAMILPSQRDRLLQLLA